MNLNSVLRGAGALVVGAVMGLASFEASAQTALPPLPEYIKSAGLLRVGVRCDQPPYGYMESNGKFAGVEVEIALQIAAYAFGSSDKVEMSCVTAENRIPQLVAKKVDLLVATLSPTPERARVIDFSNHYRWSVGGVLVPADSPIKALDDLEGKNLIALKGALQAQWFERNLPKVNQTRLNTVADATQALKQGRGDAFAGDTATLVMIVSNDKSVKLVDEKYMLATGAIGVRKNEPEWLAYINAALDKIKAENLYVQWIDKWIEKKNQEYYVDVFTKPMPTNVR